MPRGQCGKCCVDLPRDGDILTCSAKCKLSFHFKCGGLSKNSFKTMSADRRVNWRCETCRVASPVDSSRDQTSKYTKEDGEEEDKDEEKDGEKNSVEQSKNLDELNDTLKTVSKNLQNVTDELAEVKKSIIFMSANYDKVLDELKDMKNMKENYDKMKEKVTLLEHRVNQMEQYSRNKNIEIKGVQEIERENLKEVVVSIASKMGVEMNGNEIDVVHRVNNKGNKEPKDIIVQFKHRENRDKIMQSRKIKINSREVTKGGLDQIVYLNEHLTPFNKMLLWEAKSKGKEKGYKFVWNKDGKILMRKDEKDRAILIRCVEDIKSIT